MIVSYGNGTDNLHTVLFTYIFYVNLYCNCPTNGKYHVHMLGVVFTHVLQTQYRHKHCSTLCRTHVLNLNLNSKPIFFINNKILLIILIIWKS